jgi:ribonuclease Z
VTELVLLGTAASVPDPEHENTHMAIVGEPGVILIDCVSTPAVRLAKAGLALEDVNDLILTHFHPDHVSGVPLLLMNMWIMGRRKSMRVYGLHHCLKRLEDMMGSYHWESWPGFFPVAFHRLPETERVLVLENDDIRILSSPVRHLVPTIGIRIESKEDGPTIVYSSDTEPCPSAIRLAAGADVLLHEATGASVGHSSARQAGEVARQAEVGRLLLIHYSPFEPGETLLAEAGESFQGELALAQDFMRLSLARA